MCLCVSVCMSGYVSSKIKGPIYIVCFWMKPPRVRLIANAWGIFLLIRPKGTDIFFGNDNMLHCLEVEKA